MPASGSPADHAAPTVPEPARVRSMDPVLVEGVVTRLVSPFDYADRDAWDRLDAAQHAFGAAFDQLEAGVALYDIRKQRRAAVNRTLVRLLDADSELLLPELDAFARELAPSARSRSLRFAMKGNGPRRVIRTARGAYRVSAVTLPEAMVTRAGAVAVIVSRIVPVVPSSKKLIGVAGLTRREAEVAHEITLGRSNPAIASRLGLSPHTVRHHIEGVFRKLGVSSRREVAERLLSAEWVDNHGG